MKSISSRLALVAGAILLAATTLTSAFAQEFTIKFSSGQLPSNPKVAAAKKFGELVEQRTDGRVKFEYFTSGQLYKDRDEPQAIRQGNVDMVVTALVFMDSIVPDTQVYALPFMFGADPHVTKAMAQSDIGRGIEEAIEKKLGVKALGTWLSGVTMYATNKPVRAPEDFANMRIRVAGSKLWEEYVRALGGNPMTVSAGEMVTAAQQGIIDAIDSNSNALVGRKIWQVLKYGIKTSQSTIVHAVMVNGNTWRKLPPDIQKVFEEVSAEIVDWQWDDAISSLDVNDKRLIDEGMDLYIPTAAELEKFRDKLMPLQEPFLEKNPDINRDLVKRAQEFIESRSM